MRKVILIYVFALMVVTSQLNAKINENLLYKIDSIMQKQDLLSDAIDMYISMYGVVPASIAQIKLKGILSGNFNEANTTFVVTNGDKIEIRTTKQQLEVYEKDYFLNNRTKNKEATPIVVDKSLNTIFFLSNMAKKSYYFAQKGVIVSPDKPSSKPINTIWLDSIVRKLYIYTGTKWNNLFVRKLWIIKNVADLPNAATSGDGAIVFTTTQLEKYIFTDGNWFKIPQSIPFDYNGGGFN
jgi:hypothetical protein